MLLHQHIFFPSLLIQICPIPNTWIKSTFIETTLHLVAPKHNEDTLVSVFDLRIFHAWPVTCFRLTQKEASRAVGARRASCVGIRYMQCTLGAICSQKLSSKPEKRSGHLGSQQNSLFRGPGRRSLKSMLIGRRENQTIADLARTSLLAPRYAGPPSPWLPHPGVSKHPRSDRAEMDGRGSPQRREHKHTFRLSGGRKASPNSVLFKLLTSKSRSRDGVSVHPKAKCRYNSPRRFALHQTNAG